MHPTLILAGRIAGDGSEVIYQMGLVEVPKVERDLRPVRAYTSVDPLDQLMQAVAANHPLGRDTDVFAEDPLKRALADAGAAGERIHCENPGVLQDDGDKLTSLGDCLVRRRKDGTEPTDSGFEERVLVCCTRGEVFKLLRDRT
jgi:hypothetical protein